MDWLSPQPNQKLLDVAGGTGDISFRFLKRVPSAHATVFDMTQSMLDEGQLRAEAEKMANHLDWVCGDAMSLPFKDNSFDVYTISFGIRNVTHPEKALSEAYRVLRPGGRLMVLEFSKFPTHQCNGLMIGIHLILFLQWGRLLQMILKVINILLKV